jgi:outer membrane protein OmpA-like peptidoglycan-associated protein
MTGRTGLFLALAVTGTVTGCMQAGSPQGDRYLVYFDEFSANITPQAHRVIADAAAKAKATRVSAIRIEGRASATGSPQANAHLSETRTQVVADALQGEGLDPKTFKQVAIGQTSSGDTGVADRRVDIVLER